ncbi:MAG TPA: CYCXC family (seleno)protein [Pyrinomonadaceae bacterium]|nr:CYCXC family (seleno)protein [Pyrinomonadaceae bacterium]
MKRKIFSAALAFAAVAATLGCTADEPRYAASPGASGQTNAQAAKTSAANTETASKTNSDSHDGHGHGPIDPNRVPAFEQSPKNLPATLPPEMFTGMTRAAYQSVKEIPTTIAQLPCYCHCDKGFGHKSLHSCFVDRHASQCAVCVDEALAAYKMEKELKLTPEQIRERIIAEYSARQ